MRLGTRSLTLTIGDTDYSADVSNCTLTPAAASSDFVSFGDAASGGMEWTLGFTAAQDLSADSLWSQMWDNSGQTVGFEIAPYGNAAASADQPHFTGNAVISMPDGSPALGGDANTSATAVMTFTASWTCTAKPVKVTA